MTTEPGGTEETQSPGGRRSRHQIRLRYFEDVLREEFVQINARRAAQAGDLRKKPVEEKPAKEGWVVPDDSRNSDRAKLFGKSPSEGPTPARPDEVSKIDPDDPDSGKTRPRPVPCDVRGLAFSGGGIRSAAVCLGALQGLQNRKLIGSFDYLSTVSGGGYIGAGLTAAMSTRDRNGFPGGFPYGVDVADSAAIAHLRNYSNYLLPRGRSAVRNLSEAAAIVLRGLLANVVVVLATLLACALFTRLAYSERLTLGQGSFLLRLFGKPDPAGVFVWPFIFTIFMVAALAAILLVWAAMRTYHKLDGVAGDTRGFMLGLARFLLVATVIVAFLDLQPLAIWGFFWVHDWLNAPDHNALAGIKTVIAALTAFGTAVSLASSALGRFLKTSARSTDWMTLLRRAATHALLFVAAMALPLVIWVVYLYLSAALIDSWHVPRFLAFLVPATWIWPPILQCYLILFALLFVVSLFFRANGYSLHRLYRDRLSRAFLFKTPVDMAIEPLDDLKLSAAASAGPYHIINAAMNVQGSKEANKRGRNADFFIFTRLFIGSDLTMFAPTAELTFAETAAMEEKDPRLDLATAMAISGAAVSANMGTNTVRLMSPTLALLNVRLGYWLRNPRDLALNAFGRAKGSYGLLFSKFYLLMEMLNQLDETKRYVFLSDGGHIENLGVYELLKRGCELIVVVDAEADPDMAFPSLLKLERYARIDLGVRIILPWEEITRSTGRVDGELADGGFPRRRHGPHCAVGRIVYANGAEGIMVYFKSSLSGDEKDYILDYKRRFAAFPHETTSDQFFTEEQFESYRALGFHMVDGFFGGYDKFSFLSDGPGSFIDEADAMAAVMASLPASLP